MKTRYNLAKMAAVGSDISCPACNKSHKKNTYNKVFCSNQKTRAVRNCKDMFWNTVDPEKKCRNTPYFNDVIMPKIAAERGFPDVETMRNHVDDSDGTWDAHECHVENCEYCGLKPEYCRCEFE